MGAGGSTSSSHQASYNNHNRHNQTNGQLAHYNELPPNRLPSNNNLYEYTQAAKEFLKQQAVKKIAREKNLNLHGKLIKSKVGLDIRTVKLQQSSNKSNKYYPRFSYSCSEPSKLSIYFCTSQVTNAEGVPTYFTIPTELPSASITNIDEGNGQEFKKKGTNWFDINDYEGMPLFNSTKNYYPWVITIEPRKDAEFDADGVSDYQNLITYWVFKIDKSKNILELKPLSQVLVAYDMAFNLQQIYGIEDNLEEHKDGFGVYDDNIDDGQKWVICITDEKNTVVMPWGHLCVCKECATTIAKQNSPDWPICRKKVKSFVPLNIQSIKKMEAKSYTRGSTYSKSKAGENVDDGVEM